MTAPVVGGCRRSGARDRRLDATPADHRVVTAVTANFHDRGASGSDAPDGREEVVDAADVERPVPPLAEPRLRPGPGLGVRRVEPATARGDREVAELRH